MPRYARRRYVRKRKPINKKYTRNYRRRKGYGRRYTRVTRNTIRGAGFPDRMFVKLKYVDNLALSSVGSANVLWRGNSVFDPDYTYTGHQPLYFDQYAAIYNKYRVHAVKQLLQIDNASTGASCNVTVVHSTSATTFATTQQILEQTGSAVTRNIPPSRQQSVYLKYFCKTTQAFGINKTELQDADYASSVTTNPANVYYMHCHVEATDGVSSTAVNMLIRMTYYVEFFDRKDIAQS